MQRFEIIDKCEENLQKANEIVERHDINQIVKIMTRPLINRINRIKEICSIEKYNLCFVGRVGIGKSTAIANLLGLVDDSKMVEGYKIVDIPLLKTAEGRTTLCETIFQLNSTVDTYIEIERLEPNIFKELVDDYCSVLFTDSNEEKVRSSLEVHRVIGNMSNFSKKDKDSQIQYIKDVLSEDDIEDKDLKILIKNAIFKQINYENRTNIKFTYPKDRNIKDWIKQTLLDINEGVLADVPYPSKIILSLNEEDYKIDFPNFIHIVKDTRGIDGEGVREDIIEMCKDISNICIICDELTGYGNIVSDSFLKNQFIIKNNDLKFRNFVMGIEQGAKLSRVNGADGRENGKDKKREEAIANWNNICLDKNNMFFYNSYLGIKYDSDEYEIISIDFEKYHNERMSLIKNIESKLIFMYDEFSNELSIINRQLGNFLSNSIENSHKEKLWEIKDAVRKINGKLNDKHDLLYSRLEKQVRSEISAGVVRASVNRSGMYENFDIYVQAKDISFEEFDESCKAPLYHIEEELIRVFSNMDMMDEALQQAIKYKTDELYYRFREKNATDYYFILKEGIFKDICWELMKTFWGNKISGLKYRDRIADELFRVIKNKDILRSIIEMKNTYSFFSELYDFMDF